MNYITKNGEKFRIEISDRSFQKKDSGWFFRFDITNKNGKTYFYTIGISEELALDQDMWALKEHEIKQRLQEIGLKKVKYYLEKGEFDFTVRNRRKRETLTTKNTKHNYQEYIQILDDENRKTNL